MARFVRPHGPAVPTDVLLAELPDVMTGSLVPLAEVVDACVHEIYKRLVELQDILPALHDKARAREVFQFALWARRECVRLLAVVRWCREGEAVTKALNLIDFLQRQNAQFGTVIDELAGVRSGLSGTRLRNPDILTALDVLTTGTYQRLPTRFQTDFEPVTPIGDADVHRLIIQLDDVIRNRLRMVEVVPAEMASYSVADGRVHFHCPGLFRASFSLTGAQDGDVDEPPLEDAREGHPQGGTWYLLSLEWDFGIGGREGVDDLHRAFPTKPPKEVFEEIAHHCKLQLTPPPPPPPLPLESPAADAYSADLAHEERVIDAPLVRAYNLLESLGLTFQLEVLHAQAVRMQQLGWAHCFSLEISRDRQSFKISYWPRQRNARAAGTSSSTSTPSTAGTLTVSLDPPCGLSSTTIGSGGGGILRRTLNDVETSLKSDLAEDGDLDGDRAPPRPARISDRVLSCALQAAWVVERKWTGGLEIGTGLMSESVRVDPLDLDMEGVLLKVLRTHANALVKALHTKVLEHGQMAAVYNLDGGDVQLVEEEPDVWAIRVRLHGAQSIAVFVDPRSGRIVLRDKNEILSASGESRLMMSMRMVNDNPAVLNDVLVRLKLSSTADAAEQRLVYTAPKRTTPASRQRKAAMALHAPLLAKYNQLRTGTSVYDGLRVLLWTKAVGAYCFVYQLGDRRYGLTFKLLPGALNRRYLVEDASMSVSGRPLVPSVQPSLASTSTGPTDGAAVLSLNLAPPQATAASLSPTTTTTAGRPRFLPIPDLRAILQTALSIVAGRHPVGQALVSQRRLKRRAAPIVVLDDRRAVCELALGPEMLAELDRAVVDALVHQQQPSKGPQLMTEPSSPPPPPPPPDVASEDKAI